MKNNELKPITLTDFVSKTKDLLSVCGIFAALTLFSSNIVFGGIGKYLSLLFFTGFMLLWFELWAAFPNSKSEDRLMYFEQVIVFIGFIIAVYWILQLRSIRPNLAVFYTSLVISGWLLSVISLRIKQGNTFNKIFNARENEKKLLRFCFGIFLTVVVTLPIYFGVYALSRYFDSQLNQLFESTKKLQG